MSSRTEVRADRIMKVILRAGDISVQELVDQVCTSATSIRRDLARLEKRGLVQRTFGGATLAAPLLYEPLSPDISFQAREVWSAGAKRRIGVAASELIREHEIIGLTAGATTTQIARSLRHRSGIVVITNAVNIGMELSNHESIKTRLTGGALASAWTFALTGQPALNFLKDVYLDKAFISVTGFDLELGITTHESEDAAVSLAMIRNARRVIVVADSAKMGQVSSAFICSISSIHALVTDSNLPQKIHDQLIARGIEVIVA
jgi:DeoR family transcriptional regulator of aga operon